MGPGIKKCALVCQKMCISVSKNLELVCFWCQLKMVPQCQQNDKYHVWSPENLHDLVCLQQNPQYIPYHPNILEISFLTEAGLLPNTDEISLSADWGDVLCWGNQCHQGDLYLDIIRDIE